MFVAGCQATTGRSYWQELLYFVHRVGVGAELCFYWLHYLPIAKENLLFFPVNYHTLGKKQLCFILCSCQI